MSIKITDTELEVHILAEYGHEYDIDSKEQLPFLPVTVPLKTNPFVPLDQFDQPKADHFRRTGEGQYILRVLLQELADKGRIEHGEYSIEISE